MAGFHHDGNRGASGLFVGFRVWVGSHRRAFPVNPFRKLSPRFGQMEGDCPLFGTPELRG
jgi:hypothetical protein